MAYMSLIIWKFSASANEQISDLISGDSKHFSLFPGEKTLQNRPPRGRAPPPPPEEKIGKTLGPILDSRLGALRLSVSSLSRSNSDKSWLG